MTTTVAPIDPHAVLAAAEALDADPALAALDAQIAAWDRRRSEVAAALAKPARGDFAARAALREEIGELDDALEALRGARPAYDQAATEERRAAQQRLNAIAAARAVLDAVPGWLSDERPYTALDMPVVDELTLVHDTRNVLRVLTTHARRAAALLRAAGEDVPAEIAVVIKL